jgi:hypothetical protein
MIETRTAGGRAWVEEATSVTSTATSSPPFVRSTSGGTADNDAAAPRLTSNSTGNSSASDVGSKHDDLRSERDNW